MDFQLSEKAIDEITVVLILSGRLTAASAPQLREKIKQLIDEKHTNLLLSLSALSFIDSSGLATLVAALKMTRERNGWLKLAGVTPAVLQTLKLTQLDRVFSIYPSTEDALQN